MNVLGDAAVVLGAVLAGIGIGRLGRGGAEPPEAPRPPADARPDARFEQLLRSLTVGVITLDARGRVEALNAAASALFDLSPGPVRGRAIIEIVPSFELDRRVRDALAGDPSRGRISLARPAGTRVLTVATLPLDPAVDGRTVASEGVAGGALVVAADETRLHELEQTRREFISNVSHELRTPLSSIKLMLETIEHTRDDRNAVELFLPRVKHEVDRMVGLIEDLLDLTRAESGGLRLRREPLDLAALGAKIVRTFEPRAAGLGVRLRSSGDAAYVDGDSDRLAQVLVNLIDNALRHTPRGGRVDIDVRSSQAEAILVVRDTGSGIPYKDLPHVFERFYVVERSRAREATGTGLGLSIVKGIVEAHGGTVTADSELGEGTILTCAFPVAKVAPGTAADGTASGIGARRSRTSQKQTNDA